MGAPVARAVGDPVASADHNSEIQYILHLREEQASGTQGGTFTSGAWQKRLLNTVALNEITGASMAASQFILPAGTYNARGWAAGAVVGAHKTRLRQVSGVPGDLLIGSSETSTVAAALQTDSVINGRFVLPVAATLEFQHQCQTTRATSGFGSATSFGVNELYSELIITKVG